MLPMFTQAYDINFVAEPCKEYGQFLGCHFPTTNRIEIRSSLVVGLKRYTIAHEISHQLNGRDEATANAFADWVLWGLGDFSSVCDEACLLEIKNITI